MGVSGVVVFSANSREEIECIVLITHNCDRNKQGGDRRQLRVYRWCSSTSYPFFRIINIVSKISACVCKPHEPSSHSTPQAHAGEWQQRAIYCRNKEKLCIHFTRLQLQFQTNSSTIIRPGNSIMHKRQIAERTCLSIDINSSQDRSDEERRDGWICWGGTVSC